MPSGSSPCPSTNSSTCWSPDGLRELLQQRLAELSLEIRNYPTPIARCDLHLPALLEERAAILSRLELLNEGSCSPAATWINDGGFDAA